MSTKQLQDYSFQLQSKQVTRLDMALAENTPISRRRIRRAIDEGGVYVNKKRCRKAGQQLKGHEHLRLLILEQEKLIPFQGDKQLIWQRDGLYLIHKYSGQYAQEALHRSKLTLPDELAKYLNLSPMQAKSLRPVHRLDKGTSGLMLFSKNPKQLLHLQKHWHSHVEKSYLAWVSPAPAWDEQRIQSPIGKRRDSYGRYHIDAHGRACDTTIKVLQRKDHRALLQLIPHTGRTHQLRVHLHSIGCPIIGDARYGGQRHPRLLLHAHTLTINTPALADSVTWTVEPEGDW